MSGNSVTVSGSGSDINGTADSFNYCYLPVTGNFQMVARINQPTSTAAINAGAKVGVMLRATTDKASRQEHDLYQRFDAAGELESETAAGGSCDRPDEDTEVLLRSFPTMCGCSGMGILFRSITRLTG